MAMWFAGVKYAIPADRASIEFFIETTKLMPKAEWRAAGMGRNQIVLNEGSVAAGDMGAQILKDDVRLDRDMLAPPNAPPRSVWLRFANDTGARSPRRLRLA
jgi:3-keto-5-aminohexanoate cleavage enzyme